MESRFSGARTLVSWPICALESLAERVAAQDREPAAESAFELGLETLVVGSAQRNRHQDIGKARKLAPRIVRAGPGYGLVDVVG